MMAIGDRAGLAALYDQYAPILCGLGMRILGERREAEDLVHDVFLEVWKKARDYDATRGTVRGWLMLRMRSRCLDRIKSAHERRVQSMGDSEPAPVVDVSSVERCSGADAERLHAGLKDLPLDQRQAIELSYFNGLSGSEIAMRLGVPIGTVKSRVAAALDKLRAALQVESR